MDTRKKFLSYLLPQKKMIITISISVFLFLISQLSIPMIVGKCVDSFGSIDPLTNIFVYDIDAKAITIYLILTAVLALLGSFADFIFEYSVNIMSQKIVKGIRDDIFRKFNSVSVETIYQQSTGNLVQLEIGDVENVANGIFSVFKQLIQGVISIIITIVLMFVTNWILALGVILLSPLSIMMSRFVAKFSHKYFKEQSKLMSSLTSLSLETINNTELVQSFNYEDDSIAEFEKRDEALRKEGKIAQFSASWTNPTTRLVNNTIYAIIGISGIVMIGYSAAYPILAMTVGKLSSFLAYTNQYTKPFNEISSVISEYETASFSFKRIAAFLDSPDDADEGTISLSEPVNEIVFKDMDFQYDPKQPLIQKLNLTIKKGEKVAIVGPTGAGKSTIINVLMRFYDPTGGQILYNGVDGLNLKKSDIRKSFGMVLQDTWIFSGTIMENVRYAKTSATDEEVKQACRKAHAETFINSLPDGYETLISAKGGLSDGERQMLTIARVMLLDPHIVILDEATSNVDTRSEKLITDAFDKVLQGRTSIVIAHRLSTIRQADTILVLKDGNIIEKGSHDYLMGQKGFYYSLYSSQFQ
ncbi:MAG: ABC transporter ATP-binding protein [Bacilli bacterium]